MTPNVQLTLLIVAGLLTFGLWTLTAVVVGAWLGHRSKLNLSPLGDPPLHLPDWIKPDGPAAEQPGSDSDGDAMPPRYGGWRLGNRAPIGARQTPEA